MLRVAVVTLTAWIRLSRSREWAQSKLPYVAAAGLLLGLSPSRVLLVLATVVPWAAFGYGLNEIADRRQDADAGRRNRATPLGRAWLALFLAVAAVAAVVSSVLWSTGAATPVLVAAGLALAVAYSVPPVRLKERGAPGVVAGASAQWMLPVLAVAAAAPRGLADSGAVTFASLSLALGVRWMLIHQLQDADVDRLARVRTFASAKEDVSRLLSGVFALEVILLAAALAIALPRSPSAAVVLVLWAVVGELQRSGEQPLRQRLGRYGDAPLAGYYFCLLPAALALTKPTSAASLVLGALVLVLGSPSLVGSIRARSRDASQPAPAQV